MSATFLQLPKAQLEIIKAWDWYEEKEAGLGDRFKRQVHLKIKAVLENPLHYPKKGKYHEALTEDFPFLIVYHYNKKQNLIIIVSVFHTSRHPRRKYR